MWRRDTTVVSHGIGCRYLRISVNQHGISTDAALVYRDVGPQIRTATTSSLQRVREPTSGSVSREERIPRATTAEGRDDGRPLSRVVTGTFCLSLRRHCRLTSPSQSAEADHFYLLLQDWTKFTEEYWGQVQITMGMDRNGQGW